MAFNIETTVTPSAEWSSAETSTGEELDTLLPGDTSENVAPGAEDAPNVGDENEDDGIVEAEEADGTRSEYIRRANFDKVNNELKEHREWRAAHEATQAAMPQDEWAQARAEFERIGLKTPAQAAQAIEEQKRLQEARLYEAENEQIHAKIEAENIDSADNPVAYQAMFRAERAALDLHKYSVNQAKETVITRYPDADMEIISAFGSDPRQIEALAKHTHSRLAAAKEQWTKDQASAISTAEKNAVLKYIADTQKKANAPRVEGGSAAPSRNGPARQPHVPGSGFRDLMPAVRNGRG